MLSPRSVVCRLVPFALAIAGCGTAPSVPSSAPIEHLQALADTHYVWHSSPDLGRGFHVYVRLPAAPEPGARYPTVYLLDGGLTYPLLAGQLSYLRFDESLPEMVLVGISYGANEFARGNMRGTDYTAPAESRDFWGGAADFLAVLEDELLPALERDYPLDPTQRLLFGQSLGGQFVLFAARERPGLFAGLVASNPALHRNLDYFTAPTAPHSGPAPLLFVSMGSNEDPDFREPLLAWLDAWQDRPSPWHLEFVELPGQSHLSAAPEAFRRGIAWILAERTRRETR